MKKKITCKVWPKFIEVNKEEKQDATMLLAQEGILPARGGAEEQEAGPPAFAPSTDPKILKLQTMLEGMIRDTSKKITNVKVTINIPLESATNEEQLKSFIAVELSLDSPLAKEEIIRVQRLAAAAVDKMEPGRVIVLGDQDSILSENIQDKHILNALRSGKGN